MLKENIIWDLTDYTDEEVEQISEGALHEVHLLESQGYRGPQLDNALRQHTIAWSELQRRNDAQA